MLYKEYEEYKIKYYEAQNKYDEILSEKETLFIKTQPAAVDTTKDVVSGGGINNSFDTYLIAILIAVLSGVVMSGIPGGGLIGEMLIVSLYGFPLEAFPIIATIGWIVDPPATTLNVVGDVSSAMLIEKHVE